METVNGNNLRQRAQTTLRRGDEQTSSVGPENQHAQSHSGAGDDIKYVPSSGVPASDKDDDVDDEKHIAWFLHIINFAVGITLLAIAAFKYATYCQTLHENDLWFSNIQNVEREISFRTESGLYYSYYKQLIEAPNVSHGLHELCHDNLTEHPTTVNIPERMNIYQEVVLATLYKYFTFLQAWYEPIYFYLGSIFGLQGLLLGSVYVLTWQLSGTWLAGVLAAAFYVINKSDTTRASYVPPLRENFSLPFLWLQMVFITAYLRPNTSYLKERLYLHGTYISTLLFAVTWQFNQFVLLLQALTLFALQILYLAPHNKVCTLYLVQLFTMLTVWVLQFYNPMIATSLLLSFIPAALIIMYLQSIFPVPRNLRWICHSLLMCVLVVIATFTVNSVLTMWIKQDSDAHIMKFVWAKFGWEENWGVDVRLYLCNTAFQFLPYSVFERLTSSYLLPLYAITHIGLLICLLYTVLCRHTENVDMSQDTNPEDSRVWSYPPELAYHTIQTVLFGLMALTTLRMKFLVTPYMCVLAGYGVSLAPLRHFKIISKVSHGKVRLCGYLALVTVLAAVLYKNLPDMVTELEDLRMFHDPDTVELMEWIKSSTPSGAAFAGSMQLLAGVKLCTKRPITNHPHFEDAALRAKTAQLYKMYGKHSAEEVHKTLIKYNASYIILEDSICLQSSADGCGLPDMVDVHFGLMPENGPRPPGLRVTKTPRFCDMIRHGQPEYAKYFKPVFVNKTFRVYQVLVH